MTHKEPAPRARTNSSAPKPNTEALQGAFRDLHPAMQQAVAAAGYVTPTPIQEQCIPHVLRGKDVLGTAQTGTGKTAAFTLPILQRLSTMSGHPQKSSPRALILAPTRELAAQIADSIQTYGCYCRLSHTVVYGGVSQHHQVKALKRGVDILVATPGRLLDLMEQGFIKLDQVSTFVLDEVDRMLDMGFLPDIKRVLAKVPKKRQTLFFSATMAPKMEELAMTIVHDPVRVTIAADKPAVDRIVQKVLFVGKKNKDALLTSLLEDPKVDKAIIFTQMKHVANKVADNLRAAGIRGTAIHGNKSQAARTKALTGFKQGRFKVLVATDVAARGLDVDDITHVFNYDLPTEAETYVHRIGRTARAGADGDAISFCTAEDRAYLREIERLLGESVNADMEHDYHCDKAFRSTAAAPKLGGGGGGRRGRSGGASRRPKAKGSYNRFQSRRRKHSSR